MRRTTLALVIAVIISLAVATPLVITRYYLTPASQARVIEQMRATTAAAP